jgi:hypothetical protein
MEFGPWLRATSPQQWRECEERKTNGQWADFGDRWRWSDGHQWRGDRRAQNQDQVMAGDMSSENQGDELRGSSDCNGKKQEKETFHSFSKMEGESLAKKKGFQENKAENQGKDVELGELEGHNNRGGLRGNSI